MVYSHVMCNSPLFVKLSCMQQINLKISANSNNTMTNNKLGLDQGSILCNHCNNNTIDSK